MSSKAVVFLALFGVASFAVAQTTVDTPAATTLIADSSSAQKKPQPKKPQPKKPAPAPAPTGTHGRSSTPQSVRRSTSDETRERQLARDEKRWHFQLGLSGVADSNINHTQVAESDHGIVGSGAFDYRRKVHDNTWSAHYEIAAHKYSNTTQWNRTSHLMQGAWRHSVSDAVRFKTLGEISLKGTSEDRDLADRYSVVEQMDIRLSQQNTLTPAVAARWKRYATDIGRNARNPYAEMSFQHEWSQDHALQLVYRYELNDADDPKRTYRRLTYGAEYSVPFGRNLIGLEAKYKPQRYDRIIQVNGANVHREDKRWIVDTTWERELAASFAIEALYEYENRTSNDPGHGYDANLFSLTLLRKW